jgi:hypothetical protein
VVKGALVASYFADTCTAEGKTPSSSFSGADHRDHDDAAPCGSAQYCCRVLRYCAKSSMSPGFTSVVADPGVVTDEP